MMTAGSFATQTREPRQVGNQAAISGHLCVPRVRPATASCKITVYKSNSRKGVYDFFMCEVKKRGLHSSLQKMAPSYI